MGKPKLLNRVINFGLFLLAFSRPLTILARSPNNIPAAAQRIVKEATADGGRDLPLAVRFYSPAIGSVVLFEVKKMAMKKFRF